MGIVTQLGELWKVQDIIADTDVCLDSIDERVQRIKL